MSRIPPALLAKIEEFFTEAQPVPAELRRFRYRDLEQAGYGDRVTIWRRVRNGRFPKPQLDESGLPYWSATQLRNTGAEQ